MTDLTTDGVTDGPVLESMADASSHDDDFEESQGRAADERHDLAVKVNDLEEKVNDLEGKLEMTRDALRRAKDVLAATRKQYEKLWTCTQTAMVEYKQGLRKMKQMERRAFQAEQVAQQMRDSVQQMRESEQTLLRRQNHNYSMLLQHTLLSGGQGRLSPIGFGSPGPYLAEPDVGFSAQQGHQRFPATPGPNLFPPPRSSGSPFTRPASVVTVPSPSPSPMPMPRPPASSSAEASASSSAEAEEPTGPTLVNGQIHWGSFQGEDLV